MKVLETGAVDSGGGTSAGTTNPPFTEEIGPAENYIYTLMVNLEMDWGEAIAHYVAQGRVCCNPDCGKSIEQRLLQTRYCNFYCQQRAYTLRRRRGDTRLRLG